MKKFLITVAILLLIGCIAFAWFAETSRLKRYKTPELPAKPVSRDLPNSSFKKMQAKAAEAAVFAREKKYNGAVCFLIDLSLPAGQQRFFVYDLLRDTIRKAGLVTHGRCNQYWLTGRKYGNTVGCGCSSLGKYRIGFSYTGRFGLAYKLYGLDKTNDKAFERFVVLHSHPCVPGTEVKEEICQSDGCPTVSPGFLQYLTPILNESKKPVLLWIYE